MVVMLLFTAKNNSHHFFKSIFDQQHTSLTGTKPYLPKNKFGLTRFYYFSRQNKTTNNLVKFSYHSYQSQYIVIVGRKIVCFSHMLFFKQKICQISFSRQNPANYDGKCQYYKSIPVHLFLGTLCASADFGVSAPPS